MLFFKNVKTDDSFLEPLGTLLGQLEACQHAWYQV